jgi:hypothetical protein
MTLSALGIFSAAGAGGVPAFSSDYELIQTQVLGSNQASVTFSNLGDYASTYKHLQVRVVARVNFSSDARAEMDIRLNSDASNHNSHRLGGPAFSSTYISGEAFFGDFPFNTVNGNEFGAAVIDITDAFSTTKFKTLRSMGGSTFTTPQLALHSGLYRSTSALTSIQIRGRNELIYTNSRFSLYGIK